MAEATKTSLLGSFSPWASRSATPRPHSPNQAPLQETPVVLQQSSGNDHLFSLRPTPSLRSYPKDCPPLRTRWYYAVDVAKRKPFTPERDDDKKVQVQPKPKKWVSFSKTDSEAIEKAFQGLDIHEKSGESTPTTTRVPVNEDYLYDVHVEKRELEPAYWLGPIYEVKRGSWFIPEGSTLRPCDENLARQLEEQYLRVAPWRRGGQLPSTNRSRPNSVIIENSTDSTGKDNTPTDAPLSNTARLFGAHMNTLVTYQDATTAFLSSDDFMSRLGSTVYTRLGGKSGTKVVRGYSEPIKTTEIKEKRNSRPIPSNETPTRQDAASESIAAPAPPRPSALERQISSLAGLAESKDEEQLAEEDADRAQEQEMEDAREKDGEDQGRRIDHLILVTHGVGQRLGLRLDSINFVHDVNTLRKTMKAVYSTSPDLQALTEMPQNCAVQVLPICWRHQLDFPKQSLKQNRKEFDLGDIDSTLEDEYPSLQDITVEGVPAVRNLITDLAMDVLLYQSAYREHIASIVQQEANRIYALFKKRTGFQGKVSLCGHSLGSAIIFDILCRQQSPGVTRPRRVSGKTSRANTAKNITTDISNVQLDFDVANFFALGSPIALFQMLKGRTVAGRSSLHDQAPVTSPFDPTATAKDPFSSTSAASLVPITVSSPKCAELYNIFHPTDPIAYRIEPLISPVMSKLKSQPLPYVKKGLFDAPGLANMTARLGNSVMTSWYSLTSGVASSLINRSLGITGDEQALPQDKRQLISPPELTSPSAPPPPTVSVDTPLADPKKQQSLAESVIHHSGSTQAETLIDTEIETLYSGFQKQQHKGKQVSPASATSTTAPGDDAANPSESAETPESTTLAQFSGQEQARKVKREEAKVRALNSNGRVDYHIQEGMFDVSLLASIASHLSYWADEDVNHFMLGQTLRKGRRKDSADEARVAAELGTLGFGTRMNRSSGRGNLDQMPSAGDGDLGAGHGRTF